MNQIGGGSDSCMFNSMSVPHTPFTHVPNNHYSLLFRRNRVVDYASTFSPPITLHHLSKEPIPKLTFASVLPTVVDNGSHNVFISSNEQDLKKENQFVDEKEMTRRNRIGLANKGRVPWNKGREHTAETRELIRIRTLEAMKDPKVKKKNAERIHSPPTHSDQTKARISYSQRRLWKERQKSRQKLKRARELFFLSWEQNIAKAAMKGGSGQKELVWDSYDKIKEQLELHRILQAERKEKEKLMAIAGEKFIQSWTKNIAKAAKEGGSGEEELDWDSYEKIKEEMGLDQSMNLMGWIESNPLTNFMETRELIRIRTLEALKDPKVKKKNAERIHSRHSNEQDLKKENQFVDEKEMTRRKRIGLANKGRVAWNKGREHTAETRELIRIRTLEAMKDPKVKKKIAEQIHSPRSDQTKARISYSQRRLWKERQKLKRARELFFLSWEQNIAKAAMKGGSGQEELDWDSYDKIKEQLKLHRILQAEGKEKEKLMAIVGEKFVQSWTKNIAKAAKEGGSGEEELDWDCYEKIKEKAKAKEIAKQLDHS